MHIKFYPEYFNGKKLFGRTGAEGKMHKKKLDVTVPKHPLPGFCKIGNKPHQVLQHQ
jgi:hypothetical protein